MLAQVGIAKRILIATVALLFAVTACSDISNEDDAGSGDKAVEAEATTTTVAENPEVANARRSAESYLSIKGFSRTGLIRQLEFEGYSTESAVTAIDGLNINWNAEAEKLAKSYLDLQGYSHSGLVDQLIFEGFTAEEAEHGVTAVGL